MNTRDFFCETNRKRCLRLPRKVPSPSISTAAPRSKASRTIFTMRLVRMYCGSFTWDAFLDQVRGGGNIELKTTLAVRTKGTQTRKRGALSAANPLQDIVQNTVELIGGRRSGDMGFLRQPPRELFLLHVNLRIR